jgi:hypothetical protein
MKKRRVTIQDLGRVESTPVENKSGWESREAFYAREAAEEKAKAEAPLKKIADDTQLELQRTLAENSKRVRKMYSQPIADLEDAVRFGEALADPRGLPTTEQPVSNQEFDQRLQSFVDGLSAKGVTLSGDSPRRLALYCFAQHKHHGTILDLDAMLTRCIDLKIFGDAVTGELTKLKTKPEPKSEPTDNERLDDLLQIVSGESRQGKRQLEVACRDAMFETARPLYHEWLSHLYTEHGGFVPSEEDKRYILNSFIPNSNLPYGQHDTYNKARRHMVAIHRWPDSLLTSDEMLAREVEQSETRDYATRRDLNRRIVEQRTR